MFTRAIVRRPGASFVDGITTSNMGKPIFSLALEQHDAYIAALEQCGLDVTVLPAEERFPDAVFIEDTAVVTSKMAVVTNPGAESRNGEQVSVRPVLEQLYSTVAEIEPPGTLDGGDVLAVDGHFFIGLTKRTNRQGAGRLLDHLERHGYGGETVALGSFLHLKTGVAWVGGKDLLVAGELIGHPVFRNFHNMPVAPEETYAANCLPINGRVIIPAGFADTRGQLCERGYDVVEVPMSEFQKMDGGLSCLSLRF